MPTTPLPPNEAQRLDALRSCQILDTLPEPDFDDLTQLAAYICQTPIALISLIDRDRQWFKSKHGLAIQQTPRDVAFCSHTIRQPRQPLLVTDARVDPRFADNPYVTGDPHIVFYAGVALIDTQGFALGSLCVIDHQAKQLSPLQRSALRTLARQVMHLLELKKANQALQASEQRERNRAAQLERQVQQRTQELAASNADLRASNELLSRSNDQLQHFAYMASHDLQEPLRKVQQFGQLLKAGYAPLLGEGLDYLDRMLSASRRMSSLISDLLRYATFSAAPPGLVPVSLSQVVETVVADLDLLIAETKAAVVIDAPLPIVSGDAVQLQQLVQNLLSNALKFRRPGVPPLIQVRASQLPAGQLPLHLKPGGNAPAYYRLEIIDNGVGFEPKHADRIFQIFQRLHGTNEYAGTGIGLAICAQVAANHGGAITATSQPGQGATFSVYLPVVSPLA